jgi:hypothetical protein
MNMLLHTSETKLKRTLGSLVENQQANSTMITVHYVDKVTPANTPGFDANDEATYPVAPTQKTAQVGALVHYVSARTNLRQFTEIQAGDAIVTFEAAPVDVNNQPVDFAQMDEIIFEMDGKRWVQMAVGKGLAQYWDAVLGGYPISQTIVLRLA